MSYYQDGYDKGHEDALQGNSSDVNQWTRLMGDILQDPKEVDEYEDGYEAGYADGERDREQES